MSKRINVKAPRHYLETRSKRYQREQLEAGYRANAERDLAVSARVVPAGGRGVADV